jgi:ubiquinone/menaquinone biosynthesis C-methylase UbiE
MLFDDVIKKNGLVIDIGCGNGIFTKKIANSFSSITSIDINQLRIDNLKKYCLDNQVKNIYPIKMSAYSIDFPDNEFDLAVLYRSVDHIPEYNKALHEAYRVVKQSGQIYINVADTRAITPAIRATDDLRAYEDNLFDYLGIGEGMCEIRPISIEGLKNELYEIGFTNIHENVLETDNQKVNDYYCNIKANITEMLGRIEAKDQDKHKEYLAGYENVMENIGKYGIGIRNYVEIVGEKG